MPFLFNLKINMKNFEFKFDELFYLGESVFIDIRNSSINYFFDIISSNLPSWDKKYFIYIKSIDSTGIEYSEWIVLDLTNSNVFNAIEELHTHVLNSIDKQNMFNNNIFGSIIFEDEKNNININNITIMYYE